VFPWERQSSVHQRPIIILSPFYFSRACKTRQDFPLSHVLAGANKFLFLITINISPCSGFLRRSSWFPIFFLRLIPLILSRETCGFFPLFRSFFPAFPSIFPGQRACRRVSPDMVSSRAPSLSKSLPWTNHLLLLPLLVRQPTSRDLALYDSPLLSSFCEFNFPRRSDPPSSSNLQLLTSIRAWRFFFSTSTSMDLPNCLLITL